MGRFPTNFWDKGPDALRAFIQHHECNSLCDYLELDDLSAFDIDKIVECASVVKEGGSCHTARDEPEQPDNSATEGTNEP